MNKRNLILIAVPILLIVASILVVKFKTPTFETEGTITSLNAATRTASFEYQNPRTGKQIESSASIPEDCEILINDKPATLSDVRVGEKAVVRASWNKQKKEIRPARVKIVRTASASQPATAPAADR